VKTLMFLIIVGMIASILSIVVIKPFVQDSGKGTTPPEVIQQPEPK
jgi:hypothetical protein